MDRFEIRTPRLLLRPFRLTAAPDVFAYASDPEWARFLPVPQPYEPRHADEFVAGKLLADWSTGPCWALCIGDDAAVFGSFDMRVDTTNAVAELGYSLAPAAWGQGYMTEAATAVVAEAFTRWNVAKVAAGADIDNVGSWRVKEKVGMRREGHFRSHRVIHGTRRDFVHYGILRDDWEDVSG